MGEEQLGGKSSQDGRSPTPGEGSVIKEVIKEPERPEMLNKKIQTDKEAVKMILELPKLDGNLIEEKEVAEPEIIRSATEAKEPMFESQAKQAEPAEPAGGSADNIEMQDLTSRK